MTVQTWEMSHHPDLCLHNPLASVRHHPDLCLHNPLASVPPTGTQVLELCRILQPFVVDVRAKFYQGRSQKLLPPHSEKPNLVLLGESVFDGLQSPLRDRVHLCHCLHSPIPPILTPLQAFVA
jgi:hypothetical protein